MTFYLLFVLHHFDIFVHLLKWSKYNRLTLFVELRTTRAAENLLHIKDSDVLIRTGRAVIDFSSLNYDCVGGQIDTPSESRSAAKYLDVSIVEHILDQVSVLSQHTRVMGTEAELEEFFYLVVATVAYVLLRSVAILTIE